MKKFRKKPVVIEAMLFDGENGEKILDWASSENIKLEQDWLPGYHETVPAIFIQTLEGLMKAPIGDWVIKGIQGEFYPCKPDIFEATYEEVDE